MRRSSQFRCIIIGKARPASGGGKHVCTRVNSLKRRAQILTSPDPLRLVARGSKLTTAPPICIICIRTVSSSKKADAYHHPSGTMRPYSRQTNPAIKKGSREEDIDVAVAGIRQGLPQRLCRGRLSHERAGNGQRHQGMEVREPSMPLHPCIYSRPFG